MTKFTAILFLSVVLFSKASFECGLPFMPKHGFLKGNDVKPKYTPDEEFKYSCKEKYYLVGDKITRCLPNGSWSVQMPFCDPELPFSYTKLQGNPSYKPPNVVKDNNITTCELLAVSQSIVIKLENAAVVRVIKLLLNGIEQSELAVEILKKEELLKNCPFHKMSDDEEGSWRAFQCTEKRTASAILIRNQQSKGNASICEVKAYGNSDHSCEHPPDLVPEKNGQLIVSRKEATMQCSEPSKKSCIASICENEEWKQRHPETCCKEQSEDNYKNSVTKQSEDNHEKSVTKQSEDNHEKSVTKQSEDNHKNSETKHSEDHHKNILTAIIIASVMSLCFVFGCLIAVFVYLRRNRQNQGLVLQENTIYRSASCKSDLPGEPNYDTINYDDITLTPSQIRKPKNVTVNQPDLSEYTEPLDQEKYNQNTEEYIEPQDVLPNNACRKL